MSEKEKPKKPIYCNILNYFLKRKSEISIFEIAVGCFIIGQIFDVILDKIKQINILDLIKLFLSK
jgi:hypothetical protein